MECRYIRGDAFRKNLIYRLFSVYSIETVYMFDTIPDSMESRVEEYDFWQLFFIREGRCTYITEDGAAYEVTAGQAFFRPPHRKTQVAYDPKTRNSSCLISFECASADMKVFDRPPVTLYGEEISTLLELIRTGTRIFEPVRADASEYGQRLKPDVSGDMINYVSSSLERFLSMMHCRLTHAKYYVDESEKINNHVRDVRLVEEIKQYLQEHVCEHLNIDEIAAHLGVNAITMMKLFKRETATSIIRYLNDLKIRASLSMIAETSMNFNEIAEKLGFSSANYFTRVFKEDLGMTPTEFSRRQSKKRDIPRMRQTDLP